MRLGLTMINKDLTITDGDDILNTLKRTSAQQSTSLTNADSECKTYFEQKVF